MALAAVVTLLSSAAGLYADESETFVGEYRPQGALYGWLAVPGTGREFNGQEVLAMPILDAAIRLHYTADGDVRKGPLKLEPIDPQSGWVADNRTWKSGLTKIAAARDFKGIHPLMVGILAVWEPGEDAPHRAWATAVESALIPYACPRLPQLLSMASHRRGWLARWIA